MATSVPSPSATAPRGFRPVRLAQGKLIAWLALAISLAFTLASWRYPADSVWSGLAISLLLFLILVLLAGLRESERRNQAVIESALDAIILIDERGRIIEFNPAAESTFGYRRGKAVGKDFAELILPDSDGGAIRQRFREQLARGVPMFQGGRAEVRVRRADRHEFPAEAVVRRSDRDGRSFFTWFMRDATEGKQAEQARRISEARLRRAIEANTDGLWEWNIRTNEEFFSPRWWEIIGYSDADPELPHTYQSWAERIHPDDHERVQRALADHLEKGVTYDVDYRHRHKSGEYRWQHSKGKAFFDEGGRPTKMVVSVSDITERKQVEAELKRRAAEIELKNRLLEQSDRNKSEFLARMSRELRRPLEAIIGYAALLRRTPPGADGRASEFAADIEVSGREMLALVNDILELAKIESGKTELQPAPADVADLARDVVAARPDAATPSEDDVCSGDLRLVPDSASSGHHA